MARFEVSVVNVGEFSLATFCAFLIYLYTDEIDLEPVTSRFSMFRFSNCCSKIPLWIDQPTVLETTWDELLQVAIHYGIMDLQMRCKDGVFYNINKETAIATLFSISAKDPDVRRLAMDTALKSINVIFKEVEDPFAHYKDHPDYHRVMLELMRLLTNGE
ncbi:hypothetical protein EC991_005418 [Linnemannia zychae]|nr:hypothetical protein EC991_005418 [Linnemannia zychae]